jgi:hypothetical protein
VWQIVALKQAQIMPKLEGGKYGLKEGELIVQERTIGVKSDQNCCFVMAVSYNEWRNRA